MSAADPLKNIRVVLCETAHPGNIGAAARALKTMGIAELRLVRPKRFPDPQAQWLASGATDILQRARVCADLDEALEGTAFAVACSAREREIAVERVTAREAARRAVRIARTQPVALVFGNETFGLTTAEVNQCRLLATIPADPKYPSLNLAAAVQVFCYELRMAARASTAPRPRRRSLAAHEQVESFYAHLEQTMVERGFLNPEHPKKLMPRLRRLFARAQLETEEVNILRGVLRALGAPDRVRVRGRSKGKTPSIRS
ncbi:MAG: RNA methyltransferase [Betaproteobacteria bacterium]|nr:RNA methyltransferase [Betaproteobacteria bacterium]